MLSAIMPNVTYEPFILSVFILNIFMLNVVEPQIDSQRSKILSQICGNLFVFRLMHIDKKSLRNYPILLLLLIWTPEFPRNG
jgi:hypothetical protein